MGRPPKKKNQFRLPFPLLNKATSFTGTQLQLGLPPSTIYQHIYSKGHYRFFSNMIEFFAVNCLFTPLNKARSFNRYPITVMYSPPLTIHHRYPITVVNYPIDNHLLHYVGHCRFFWKHRRPLSHRKPYLPFPHWIRLRVLPVPSYSYALPINNLPPVPNYKYVLTHWQLFCTFIL